MEEIKKINNKPEQKFELFVSKIPFNMGEEKIVSYFKKYGEVKHIEVKQKNGNLPKIAYLFMNNIESYEKILRTNSHIIEESEVDVEELLTGDELKKKEKEISLRRISVFGIYGKISNDDFLDLFKVFGEVEIGYTVNYRDNPIKRYGFVTFKNRISVDKACKAKKIKINGKNAKIKKFVFKEKKIFDENSKFFVDRTSQDSLKVTESLEPQKIQFFQEKLACINIRSYSDMIQNFKIYYSLSRIILFPKSTKVRKEVLFGGKESVKKISLLIDRNHFSENIFISKRKEGF